MNKPDHHNIASLLKPPASILLVGDYDDALTQSEQIMVDLEVNNFDVLKITPQDSSGKENIISIKQIKEAQHFIGLTPNGKIKAIIIYRAELMNREAANALLKTLEEPPYYAIIVLTASNLNLLPTIISRCHVIHIKATKASELAYDYQKILRDPFWQISALAEKISANQETASFLNGMERYFMRRTDDLNKVSGTKKVKEIIKAKQDLKNNVNDRLIIESLILKFKYNV